ncbi:hypothetical protein ABT090_15175, partial [Streptomyces asoensis]|uniref:hypothetical protein n=1 Tax=Streptomyces asoensis TaxID=249586 RepID=UPI003333B8E5
LEQLETDPARFLPETTDEHLDDSSDVVRIDPRAAPPGVLLRTDDCVPITAPLSSRRCHCVPVGDRVTSRR